MFASAPGVRRRGAEPTITMPGMQAQPLIAVQDVPTSRRWYQAVLRARSGRGGNDYEQIVHDGRMILQPHRWDAHHQPHLGRPDGAVDRQHDGKHRHNKHGDGNDTVLWFQTDMFDQAMDRIRAAGALVLEGQRVNPNAQHREVWLRDPDDHVVVVAGHYGDIG